MAPHHNETCDMPGRPLTAADGQGEMNKVPPEDRDERAISAYAVYESRGLPSPAIGFSGRSEFLKAVYVINPSSMSFQSDRGRAARRLNY